MLSYKNIEKNTDGIDDCEDILDLLRKLEGHYITSWINWYLKLNEKIRPCVNGDELWISLPEIKSIFKTARVKLNDDDINYPQGLDTMLIL